MHKISARAEAPLKGHDSVVALLFQENAGTVYTFLKQHLLKRESTQQPVRLRLEWLHTDHVTALKHSTALRLSQSLLRANF